MQFRLLDGVRPERLRECIRLSDYFKVIENNNSLNKISTITISLLCPYRETKTEAAKVTTVGGQRIQSHYDMQPCIRETTHSLVENVSAFFFCFLFGQPVQSVKALITTTEDGVFKFRFARLLPYRPSIVRYLFLLPFVPQQIWTSPTTRAWVYWPSCIYSI